MELPTVLELAPMIESVCVKSLAMIAVGASRLGTSSTAEILTELRRRRREI